VKLTGGLGNQLFKFANGLRISRHFGSELVLETSFYDLVSRHEGYATPREFDLAYFPKLAEIPTKKSNNLFLNRLISKAWRESPEILQKRLGFYTEGQEISDFHGVRRVEGSFEDLKYFPPIELLSEYLQFPEENSFWLEKNLKLIESEMPLSIHVRLTDFLKLPGLYNVVTPEYYALSVSNFQRKYPGRPIWLFSDDPRGALDFLGQTIKVDRIMGPEKNISPGEVLNLMSRSLGVCTANSTFSWWAAFLGTTSHTTKYVSIPQSFNTLISDNPREKLMLPGWKVI
jgi:hypothetical protein